MKGPATFSPDDVVVGHSARMRAIFDFVKVVSRSDSSVIITGESGTGKEVIANLLHYSSSRRHQPFVAVSCALFSENLIETELFGHERGAFTGAIKDKPGRFEMAQGGTLFLDDIDDVPLSMQVKLLRAIQNRTVERVGGTRSINVNVRVITGSKKDLRQMVAEGSFREDLYYRLNVLPIVLPPLRERREDIPVLADFFFRRFAKARGIEMPAVSPAVRYAFSRYRWPGNVRELENSCERIVQTCTCGTVRAGCLGASMLFDASNGSTVPVAADLVTPADATAISLDDRLREVESNLISWALKVSDGNKSRAAELLSIKRSTLGDRIARCGLTEPAAKRHDEAAPVTDPGEPLAVSA
jgi:DNA-binding NtrC family response regulator